MKVHDPIPAAESALRARTEELAAAREALARAETAATSAAETAARTKELAESAAVELNTAAEAATEAETAWTADQTPARWTKLSNAKGARDQAEVRARSLRTAADGAEADHAAATLRVAGARADLEAAEARHQRAADVLEGFRADRAAADEESAQREGERRRALATFKHARELFTADTVKALAAPLARYVAAARELSDAMTAIDGVVVRARQQAEDLRAEGARLDGFAGAPPHDLVMNAHAWQLCGIAVERAGLTLPAFLANARLAIPNGYNALQPTERDAIDAATPPSP